MSENPVGCKCACARVLVQQLKIEEFYFQHMDLQLSNHLLKLLIILQHVNTLYLCFPVLSDLH